MFRTTLTTLLLCTLLVLAAPAAADATLKSALGLSMAQAQTVTGIERAHRPAYVAKRGQYTREARALRRARVGNDVAGVARQEPIVAALAAELKQLRDDQDRAIRAVLDARQQRAFDDYIAQRKAMVGASRDERIFD